MRVRSATQPVDTLGVVSYLANIIQQCIGNPECSYPQKLKCLN